MLYSYLSSQLGQKLIDRGVTGGTGQLTLPTAYLKMLPIPRFGKNLIQRITSLVKKSSSELRNSQQLQSQAEQALLSALNLDNWQPPAPLTYEASANRAFTARRLDAEFFQPKFDALQTKIQDDGSSKTLVELCGKISRGKQPSYAESGLHVINSKHVNGGEVRFTDNRYAESDKRGIVIKKGNVLINGTGVGTIGRSAPYLEAFDSLPDNHVTVLKVNEREIDPIYLSTFLNSVAGQMQVDQYFRGSSGQIELYPDDISGFQIWCAPKKLQKTISQGILKARAARQASKILLEQAKRAIEIAIEQNEAAALTYLSENS